MKQPKLTVTVDVTKIPREKIVEREAKDKNGNAYIAKEVKFDVIPVKPENVQTIAEGDTWALKKTHFTVISPSKEERQNRVQTPFVGDAVQFTDKNPSTAFETPKPSQSVTPEDIPF